MKPKFSVGDKVIELYPEYPDYPPREGFIEKHFLLGEKNYYVISQNDPKLGWGSMDFNFTYFSEKNLMFDFGEILETDPEFCFYSIGCDIVNNEWEWKYDKRTDPKSKSKDYSVFYES